MKSSPIKNLHIETTLVNKTIVKATIEWEELMKLLYDTVAQSAGVVINGGTNITVTIDREKSGSIGNEYNIDRWKAHILLDTDNNWQPEPEAAV